MIMQTMKSPFSGGDAKLCHESSVLTFRKEQFCYVHQFYECQNTHERFTTTELDEANLAQVYNKYRAKYGIPFPEEIRILTSSLLLCLILVNSSLKTIFPN